MFYSISHRASGVFLSIGALLITAWLFAIASGETQFIFMQNMMGSHIGKGLLFLWSWALFYHLINGCRHLIWDAGKMMSLTAGQASGHIGFALSIIFTTILWLIGYGIIGG